jgi:flagellar basal-body rod protein FlgB
MEGASSVQGRTSRTTQQGIRPTVLIDSTQLALERAMEGAGLRQQALAANIANVNTPGYQRQDVDFHSVLAGAMDTEDPSGVLEATSFSITQDAGTVVRADGSGIDLDAEAAKLAANGLEYEQLATAARVRVGILRAAMGIG